MTEGAVFGGLFLSSGIQQALSASNGPASGKVDTLLLEQVTATVDHPLVTMKRVMLPPGYSAAPHRHSGPVFGYLLEGKVVIQMENQQPATYKQGQAWYEPPGLVHNITRNPDSKRRALFLAVIIGEQGKPDKSPP
jgi:quercetin dioxygenase-like cupin family protein